MSFGKEIQAQINSLITQRLGLQIRAEDVAKFHEITLIRLRDLKLARLEDYLNLLSGRDEHSNQEWRHIVVYLTNAETYFFRDQLQMSLLREWILPDLIRRRSESHCLNILSAACSSGEEPYTIAMLLDELLPDLAAWDISILGTDINHKTIHKAQEARYGEWSFRRLGNDIRQRYFHKDRKHWVLDKRIRKMVDFRVENLLDGSDPHRHADNHTVDLIICRNVFIYFEHNAVARVLEHFNDRLADGGYLLTGHGELLTHNTEHFQVRVFPESVIYQRPVARVEKNVTTLVEPQEITTSAIVAKTSLLDSFAQPHPSEKPLWMELYEEASALLKKTNYAGAMRVAKQLLAQAPESFESRYMMAQLYANLGKYQLASENCRLAIEAAPDAIEPYYLLAFIHEQQGKAEEAISAYIKVIELDPDFVPAMLELSAFYESQGDIGDAEKLRRRALMLLRNHPNSSKELYPGIMVKDTKDYLERLLGVISASTVNDKKYPVWERRRNDNSRSTKAAIIQQRRNSDQICAIDLANADLKKTHPLDEQSLLKEALVTLDARAYTEAIRCAQRIVENNPMHYQALMVMAKAHANMGQHKEALMCSEQAIAVDPLAKDSYFLMAQVRQEQQDAENALAALKKVIYLAPEFVPAYLQAGQLYQQKHDKRHARQMYMTAAELLTALPTETPIDSYEPVTAGELAGQISSILRESSDIGNLPLEFKHQV